MIIKALLIVGLATLTNLAFAGQYQCQTECRYDYESSIDECEYDENDAFADYKDRTADRSMDRIRSSHGKSFSEQLSEFTRDNLESSRRLNRLDTATKQCKSRASRALNRCTSSC